MFTEHPKKFILISSFFTTNRGKTRFANLELTKVETANRQQYPENTAVNEGRSYKATNRENKLENERAE